MSTISSPSLPPLASIPQKPLEQPIQQPLEQVVAALDKSNSSVSSNSVHEIQIKKILPPLQVQTASVGVSLDNSFRRYVDQSILSDSVLTSPLDFTPATSVNGTPQPREAGPVDARQLQVKINHVIYEVQESSTTPDEPMDLLDSILPKFRKMILGKSSERSSIVQHANLQEGSQPPPVTRKHSFLYKVFKQEEKMDEPLVRPDLEAVQAQDIPIEKDAPKDQVEPNVAETGNIADLHKNPLPRTYSWTEGSESNLTMEKPHVEKPDKIPKMRRGSSFFKRILHLDDPGSESEASSLSTSPQSTPPGSPRMDESSRKLSLEGVNFFRDLVGKKMSPVLENVSWNKKTPLTPTPTSTTSTGNSPLKPSASFLERYKQTSVLGKGANGVVRLAKRVSDDDSSPMYVAIKQFRRKEQGESDKDWMKKVIGEFCIATTMHHPHVIETFDLVQDGGKWCSVMEYLGGGDLYSSIISGNLKGIEQINCYFGQALSGLAYLHNQLGVAHRDLKPENLLLDMTGRWVKISDFGVSTVYRTPGTTINTLVRGTVGSEPYIPPEGWMDQPYDASKADVWSMGILLYTMLYSCVPWRFAKMVDGHFAYFMNHLTHFKPIRTIPSHTVRKCLEGMLKPDPKERWTVEQVQEKWSRFDICQIGQPANHDHEPYIRD